MKIQNGRALLCTHCLLAINNA